MLVSYCPEMHEPKPESDIEAVMSSGGSDHWYLKTPLVLRGRGIVFLGTYTAETLHPQAQHKIGWHRYRVTEKAFELLVAQYKVSTESLL